MPSALECEPEWPVKEVFVATARGPLRTHVAAKIERRVRKAARCPRVPRR